MEIETLEHGVRYATALTFKPHSCLLRPYEVCITGKSIDNWYSECFCCGCSTRNKRTGLEQLAAIHTSYLQYSILTQCATVFDVNKCQTVFFFSFFTLSLKAVGFTPEQQQRSHSGISWAHKKPAPPSYFVPRKKTRFSACRIGSYCLAGRSWAAPVHEGP